MLYTNNIHVFKPMWIEIVASFIDIVKSKACLNIYIDGAFQGLQPHNMKAILQSKLYSNKIPNAKFSF